MSVRRRHCAIGCAIKNSTLFWPIGDDHDDEELFAALPAHGYSIRVGIVRTSAHFNLREPKNVIKLLEELRWAQNPPKAAANHCG